MIESDEDMEECGMRKNEAWWMGEALTNRMNIEWYGFMRIWKDMEWWKMEHGQWVKDHYSEEECWVIWNKEDVEGYEMMRIRKDIKWRG